MDDLARLFNARLSPGTVGPQLHELENGGLLQMHEKIRTKEYNISDDKGVRTRLERSMYQHLAFGYAIYLALEDDCPGQLLVDDFYDETCMTLPVPSAVMQQEI